MNRPYLSTTLVAAQELVSQSVGFLSDSELGRAGICAQATAGTLDLLLHTHVTHLACTCYKNISPRLFVTRPTQDFCVQVHQMHLND